MVPENIIWAAFSPYDYQRQIEEAAVSGKSEPKDVYYKNTKGEYVKVTAVFDCVEKLRRSYNSGDSMYLGPVFADSKGEVERGRKYPPVPEDKNTLEERRKDEIRTRLLKSRKMMGKMKDGSLQMPTVTKDLSAFWQAIDNYNNNDLWNEPGS